MKKYVCTAMFSLTFIALSFAQDKKDAQEGRIIGTTIINRNAKGNKVLGSPYLQKMFASAKVQNIAQNTNMRYNVYTDEFEFISTKSDTLIMDKIEDFGTVTFNGSNKKYVLSSYTNSKNKLAYGYLVQLYEKGGFALFQKENVDFYEFKPAKTSLERDMPARYEKGSDTYYLKNKEAGISEFPDGKKALIKLFPDKKAAIEAFVKENKIAFDEKADMIRIIDFLATL